MKNNSNIIDFYYGAPTIDSHLFDDIMSWGPVRLEKCHNYIQWVFPAREPSLYNPTAPLLTRDDIWIFKEDEDLRLKVSLAVERMMEFYFHSTHWLSPGNHNYLRITRILKFLNIIGMYATQDLILEKLDEIYKSYPNEIGRNSYEFWRGTR